MFNLKYLHTFYPIIIISGNFRCTYQLHFLILFCVIQPDILMAAINQVNPLI